MNSPIDTATELLTHYANAPKDFTYCGMSYDEAIIFSHGQAISVDLATVDCVDCLTTAITRWSLSVKDLRATGRSDGHPDVHDLELRVKEAAARLGELSLKAHHPDLYEQVMREKNRPEEPTELLAIVEDARGVRFVRWAYDTHTHQPWMEVGAVHLIPDDPFRWDQVDAVAVVFPGVARS